MSTPLSVAFTGEASAGRRPEAKNFLKAAQCLLGGLVLLALTARADGYLAPPTGDFLVLSNLSGTVRVLDAQGLILERNHAYLPRILLTGLSTAQLRALLETRIAYAGLAAFPSACGTNAQSAVIEHQLQQIWRQGHSLAEKIQTRLEILQDLRDYNNEIALLPDSQAAAAQYAVNDIPINSRLTNRVATLAVATAQVEATAVNRASGPADQQAAQQAEQNLQAMTVRAVRANDRNVIASNQIIQANQQVADHQTRCAALAARLALHGITVSAVAPFEPIPPLALRVEVNTERKAK